MSRKALLREILLTVMIMILLTALLAAAKLDLGWERHFYVPGAGWVYGNAAPWHFLYRFGVIPAYLVAGGSLLLYAAGYITERPRRFRRGALFFVLLLALGPGLLVNTVFKDHWGRPRPRQMQIFGGNREFHQVWQDGTPGEGESFPSGHASAAFYLVAPYFVLRRRARKCAYLALAAGSCYGILMGVARMAQGGHFASDVLWAAGIDYLVGAVLCYLLKLDEKGVSVGEGGSPTQVAAWARDDLKPAVL